MERRSAIFNILKKWKDFHEFYMDCERRGWMQKDKNQKIEEGIKAIIKYTRKISQYCEIAPNWTFIESSEA